MLKLHKLNTCIIVREFFSLATLCKCLGKKTLIYGPMNNVGVSAAALMILDMSKVYPPYSIDSF